MSTIGKKQIFKAIKFRTLKSAKFYSSEIKWVNNSLKKSYVIQVVRYGQQYHMAMSNRRSPLWDHMGV